jgi:hypothetical protein
VAPSDPSTGVASSCSSRRTYKRLVLPVRIRYAIVWPSGEIATDAPIPLKLISSVAEVVPGISLMRNGITDRIADTGGAADGRVSAQTATPIAPAARAAEQRRHAPVGARHARKRDGLDQRPLDFDARVGDVMEAVSRFLGQAPGQ